MDKMNKICLERVAIRQLEEDEVDRLVPIYLDAFQGMTSHELITEWARCNLRAFPQKVCFGAWYENSLVGYAVWAEKGGFRTKAVWELEQIAVLSEYRKHGIGTKLIRDSLAEIKAHTEKRGAILKIVLVTTEANNASATLYKRILGARQEGTIRDFYKGDEQIMVARFEPQTQNLEKVNEFLKTEYGFCQDGYNNRDVIVPQEMTSIILVFSALTALLTFISGRPWPQPLFFAAVIIIFAVGFLSLSALHIDITSTISCKKALRDRMTEIESLLSGAKNTIVENSSPQMWKCIDERKRLWDEKLKENLFKPKSERHYLSFFDHGQETPYFVLGGRCALLLWFLIFIGAVIWGLIK